jgi:hypothetical protein
MPTISCTEFSRQLADAVERRQTVDTAALREHAGSCPECRSQWLDAQLVDRAITRLKKPLVPAGLTERILLHVAAGTSPAATAEPLGPSLVPVLRHGRRETSRPRRRANRIAAVALTALGLCVCAMLFLGRPVPPREVAKTAIDQKTPPIAAVGLEQIKNGPGPRAKEAASATVGAPVELMVADAGSAYLHLAGNAAKAVTAATVLVPPADAVREAPPTPKGQEPWVDDVRREIAPVTHQLGHAFEFLIQAVPEKRAPAT